MNAQRRYTVPVLVLLSWLTLAASPVGAHLEVIGTTVLELPSQKNRSGNGFWQFKKTGSADAKIKKARARLQRLQRGMFPKEMAEFLFAQRKGPDGILDKEVYLRAKDSWLRYEKSLTGFRKAPDPQWTPLGPDNIGGRLIDLAFHPTDPNIMWLPTPGGGIWKTTDGGRSWRICDDFLPCMAVTSLAVSQKNPSILFASTGELLTSRALWGMGIFRSTDGGETWRGVLSGIPDHPRFKRLFLVRTIRIHPQDDRIVLAGSLGGIVRSQDGGETWRPAYVAPEDYRNHAVVQIAFDPSAPDVVFATLGLGGRHSSKLLVSRQRGASGSWKEVTLPGLQGNSGRISLGIGKSDGKVYASVGNAKTQGALALYCSRDRGQTWELVYDVAKGGTDFLGRHSPYQDRYDSGQQWLNNTVAVDPRNSDILMIGGIDIYRSEDGGKTIKKVTKWSRETDPTGLPYVHADIHAIRYSPFTPSKVFVCCDGGLFTSDDGGIEWKKDPAPMPITQIYSFAVHPLQESFIAGCQDNGTIWRWAGEPEGKWTLLFGGDGGHCAWDSQTPVYKYGSAQELRIMAHFPVARSHIVDGIDQKESRIFISPFIVDPNNGEHALAGTTRLYRHTSLRSMLPNIIARKPVPPWKPVSPALHAGKYKRSSISCIAIDPSNSQTCWVGSNDGEVHVCRNLDAQKPEFIRVGKGQLPDKCYISCIAVHPRKSECVFVTATTFFVPHVWLSQDGGKTWENRGSNLPPEIRQVPVTSVVFDTQDPNRVFLGTDMGVLVSSDLGKTWEPMNKGLSFSPVTHMVMKGDTLYASTFGRGLYKIRVGKEAVSKSTGGIPVRLLVLAPHQTRIMAVAKLVDKGIEQGGIFTTVGSFNDLADVNVSFGHGPAKDQIRVMNNENECFAVFPVDGQTPDETLAGKIVEAVKIVGMSGRLEDLSAKGGPEIRVDFSPKALDLPAFRLGREFKMQVSLSRDGYLYVLAYGGSGSLGQLFPAAGESPRPLQAGRTCSLTMKATGKAGSERMLILASDSPLKTVPKDQWASSTLTAISSDLGIMPGQKGFNARPANYTAKQIMIETVDPAVYPEDGKLFGEKEMMEMLLRIKSDEARQGQESTPHLVPKGN